MSAQVPQRATPRPRQGRLRGITRGGLIVLVVIFAISAGVGYNGYQRVNAAPAAPLQTVRVARGNIAASVSASGTVVATKQSKLSFTASGKLQSLSVNVGDSVKAGQVLAQLDTTSLQIALEQAQSNLRSAQTKLDQLKAPPQASDVAAARAALQSAIAKYNDTVAGPTASDLKSAEQAVASAQASLNQAQASYDKLVAPPSQDAVTAAKASLEKAKAALAQAQGNYDKVAWRPDIGARPEALALQQATTDYDAALANYNIQMAPPKPEDVAAAQQQLESAKQGLAVAQQKLADLKAGPKPADVDAAKSAVASAQSALDAKTSGPTAQDIALQQEQINQAQISVRQAQMNLDGAKIVAPFDGVVAAISGNPGEQVGSGTAVVTLLDPKAVRVDATVDESEVAQIAVGKTAQVTFDAIPGANFDGKVIAVAPTATVVQGVVSYLVSVQLDPGQYNLPAGMTANATIITQQVNNVLYVPNRTIRNQNRQRVVEVEKADGTTEMRPVRVGLSNDTNTEITSGLSEGETVVVPNTTAATPRVGGMGGFGGGPVFVGPGGR